MDLNTLEMLKKEALDTRIKTIECISSFGSGHIGGAMSIVELITYLYYKEMKVDPANPSWPDRDRLVLSKGHSGPSLYAMLAKKGFFPLSWLETLNKGGTNLPSHVDMTKTPGIDFTAGSLGQGIAIHKLQKMSCLKSPPHQTDSGVYTGHGGRTQIDRPILRHKVLFV